MSRHAAVVSVGVLMSLLVAGQARAQEVRGLSAGLGDHSSSLVASFLAGDSPELAALEGSFATSPPELSIPETLSSGMSDAGLALASALLPAATVSDAPTRLTLARPRTPGEVPTASASKAEPVTRRVKPRSGPDPLEFSRAAFPMVVGPAPVALAGIRPMVGPVVGVRPAYIRPASFE